jgi:hypothetical protein
MIRIKRIVEEKEKNPIKEFQTSTKKFKNLGNSEKIPYDLNLLIYQSKICLIKIFKNGAVFAFLIHEKIKQDSALEDK